MTVPTVEGILTQPYVTVAEFKTAPTWLDVDNLVPGGIPEQQDAELFNVLLRASAWADNWCAQRLGAHTVYEQMRCRPDRYGTVILHPSNVPVRQVTGLAYGANFQNLTVLTDLTQVWVEDARGIVISLIPQRGSFFGSLEFGGFPVEGTEIFIEIAYVSGYASTTLTATAATGSNTLSVADATGFQVPFASLVANVRGSTARIWNPGQEEAVAVSSINGNTLTLASNLANTHTPANGPGGQIGVSELPAEVHQAVVCMAVALMMREDVSEEDPFAGSPYGPATRKSGAGGKAGGLLDNAYELLDPYRRVR